MILTSPLGKHDHRLPSVEKRFGGFQRVAIGLASAYRYGTEGGADPSDHRRLEQRLLPEGSNASLAQRGEKWAVEMGPVDRSQDRRPGKIEVVLIRGHHIEVWEQHAPDDPTHHTVEAQRRRLVASGEGALEEVDLGARIAGWCL